MELEWAILSNDQNPPGRIILAKPKNPLKILRFVPIDMTTITVPLRWEANLLEDLNSALAAASRNDSWGWSVLYRHLAATVTGYLRSQGAAEPEDLAAEVFLQAVKNIRRFTGDVSAFRSWIFCIAHNKLIDDARYRSRRPVHPTPDAGYENVHGISVEDQVMGNFATDRVQELIAALTPDQRGVLYLRIVGALTIEEVAQALNKNAGAVKALQRRGLASIRKEMSQQTVSF